MVGCVRRWSRIMARIAAEHCGGYPDWSNNSAGFGEQKQ